MFKDVKTFSSFAVTDLKKAKEFYGQTLGVDISDVKGMEGLIELHLEDGRKVMIYEKKDLSPANSTTLHFIVDDIDQAVDELVKKGVTIDKYEGFHQDEKGIARGKEAGIGPDIAWFKDPSGNVLAVLQE